MNSQKTLLIGLLVTAAAIVLFETGTLRLDQNTFQAQAGMADMVLENSGERAVIRAGSPIFIESRTGNSLAGNLVGVEDGTIFITDIKGDETGARLSSSKKSWGPGWRQIPLHTQDEIVLLLLEAEDESSLIERLIKEHGLSRETAINVSKTALPTSRAALSLKAASSLLPCLAEEVRSYDKAVSCTSWNSNT